MPLIDGSGFSLLPTPLASDAQRRPHLSKLAGTGGSLITAVIRAELNDGWATYRPAIQRWETRTRPAPPPAVLNRAGRPGINPAFPEWMMGWPDGWVTDAGIPRADQLWIIGNGVCPQQAAAALEALGFPG